MGRAPCCEKMGLKKGPWTPEEDQILISYIRQHGHTNWRALPKHAGLLRCGKSCRLRWINYLRPDIKRGNFTQEEEETIIKLHETLGNRWSTIAARLSGRTDNEIKNVWHTHLKKRLPMPNQETDPPANAIDGPTLEPIPKRVQKSRKAKSEHVKCVDPEDESSNNNNNNNNNKDEDSIDIKNGIDIKDPIMRDPVSPHPSTSEISTITSTSENDNVGEENVGEKGEYFGDDAEINDDFWKEVLSVEDTAMSTEDFACVSKDNLNTSLNHLMTEPMLLESSSKIDGNDMHDFWYNLLTKPKELPEILEMM